MIGPFRGVYRYLSNFYPAEVTYGEFTYPTTEHAYQAAKSVLRSERAAIAKAATPGDAKRMGYKVKLRKDWDSVKQAVMLKLLRQKFSREPLRSELLSTANQELVEVNTWNDTYWGVCNGVGSNNLGKLLMKVRDELRNTNQ